MEDQIEFELDLWELLRFLKKKIILILTAGLICGCLGWAMHTFAMEPEYTASTRVYVLSRSNDNSIVYSDIQISTYVSYDFEVLITGPNVTEEVIRQLNLDMTDAELASRITVTPMEGTRVLQIDFTHKDPQLAADIVNCVREVSGEQIRSFVDADAVKTVYEAKVPRTPSSPGVSHYILLGAMLGVFLVGGFCCGRFILDDTIRTEEDVNRYLGLSVLGEIPMAKELEATKPLASKRPRSSDKGASGSRK